MVVASVVSGVAAALCHVSPTGLRGTDIVVTFLFAMAVAWIAASAPWWLLAIVGGLGALASGLTGWTAAGLVAVGIGLTLGRTERSLPWLRSLAMGAALLALLHLRVNPFFGASAIMTGAIVVGSAVFSLSRREGIVRRRLLWCSAGLGGFVILAVVGLAIAGVRASGRLDDGYQHLTDGLDQLRAGDTVAAATSLRAASGDLAAADESIDSWWAKPSALLPVVGQHREALRGIVSNATVAASTAADALSVADLGSFRVDHGTIDVDALALLSDPLAKLDIAVQRMVTVIHDTRSPWLIGVAQDKLGEAERKLADAAAQSDASAAAAKYGPAMLGTEGPRKYLVVFTSPGEARGQSGLIGNWAEITITKGTIAQTGFGRTAQLIAGLTSSTGVQLNESAEYFARYGPYGAGSATAPVVDKYWSNVTMSPDTPTVGSTMAQMYEGAGMGRVDGVFVLDPTALSSLLKVAGSITVPGIDQTITADTMQQFLLFDQYKLDDITRRTVLEAVAGVTLQQFLGATLPAPQQVAADLGPASTQGHITGWARRPEEENLFRLIGMAGQLPGPAGRDGLAVVTNNASGNKIDSFLKRTVAYDAQYDSSTGRVSGGLTVTLDNTAPTTGYPDYVIGNIIGLPTGTNRTLLTIDTPLQVTAVTIDGVTSSVTSGTELGWNTASMLIDLAPGQKRAVHFTLAGTVAKDSYRFVWRPQPLTNPDQLSVAVTAGDASVASFAGTLPRLSVIDSNGHRALR